MKSFREYIGDNNTSVEEATLITDRYMRLLFEDRRATKIEQEYSGLELNDINANLDNLKAQLGVIKKIGFNKFPCILIGKNKIPIDIFQYFENREKARSIFPDIFDSYIYRSLYYEERMYRLLGLMGETDNETISMLSFDDIRENISKALHSFIEIRHTSFFNENIKNKIFKFFKGSSSTKLNSVSTKYLTVKLSANHHGLDISASPVYFVTWKKFGSPTSPIKGYLIPATYIFGGIGVSVPVFKHDPTPIDIPPNFNVNIKI